MQQRKKFHIFSIVVALGYFGSEALAQRDRSVRPRDGRGPLLQEADLNAPSPGVSPTRRINRRQAPAPVEVTADSLFRSFDGSGNNLDILLLGRANTPLLRLVTPDYDDGVESLSGVDRPSARLVSNLVVAQPGSIPNASAASDFLWQWGQFLDHDIDLTDGVDPPEAADIPVPAGDPWFDPNGSGTAVIALNRSLYDLASGSGVDNPRQQLNEVSAWIDASNVYGSDLERADALRVHDGSGSLLTSGGDLLPFNDAGLENAGGDSPALFLAGDVRANEQVGLTAMHTLFMREHNRLADALRTDQPGLSGDEIYQQARQIVGAQMQIITYREYLPALLGNGVLDPYSGYQADVDASIASVFSSALFRYGHSALSPVLQRLDVDGQAIEAGHLALRDAFFSPSRIIDEGGIEPLLRGLASQVCQEVDNYVIDDVRNFLFGEPGSGGFDLPALNIQRGRDHGLASYNAVRAAFNLSPADAFSDITSNSQVQAALAAAYGSVDDIDVWVGALAEDKALGALVGELIQTALKEQFEALRDGDRFWYQRTLSQEQQRAVQNTRLADIIRRNTSIGQEIADDVFHVSGPSD